MKPDYYNEMLLFELSDDVTYLHLLCARPQRDIHCQDDKNKSKLFKQITSINLQQ